MRSGHGDEPGFGRFARRSRPLCFTWNSGGAVSCLSIGAGEEHVDGRRAGFGASVLPDRTRGNQRTEPAAESSSTLAHSFSLLVSPIAVTPVAPRIAISRAASRYDNAPLEPGS